MRLQDRFSPVQKKVLDWVRTHKHPLTEAQALKLVGSKYVSTLSCLVRRRLLSEVTNVGTCVWTRADKKQRGRRDAWDRADLNWRHRAILRALHAGPRTKLGIQSLDIPMIPDALLHLVTRRLIFWRDGSQHWVINPKIQALMTRRGLVEDVEGRTRTK